MGFLKFSVNMVYVWCKYMPKGVKKGYVEVKRIFENFYEYYNATIIIGYPTS